MKLFKPGWPTGSHSFPCRISRDICTFFRNIALLLIWSAVLGGLTSDGFASNPPVSFSKEIVPLFRRSCNACHQPSKQKGGLDLTTHGALMKGGKHGVVVVPRKPGSSRLLKEISGDEPSMPEEGDPLSRAEVALIVKWIAEGARDDGSSAQPVHRLVAPPVYKSLPAITALAWSGDGHLLASPGWHEVILHDVKAGRVVARLMGESPRIESLAFSPDGRFLAVAGGAVSEYGEIQIWNVALGKQERSVRIPGDVLFGVSWSPDNRRIAAGCSDKMLRAFDVSTGQEVMKCDNHIDWVFGTAWSLDGSRIASAGRDRALKLIDVATGRLIDDINRQTEPLVSLARHPTENIIVCGTEKGEARVYRMEPRGGRLAEGDDKENGYVRQLESLSGSLLALAWSSNGSLIAGGSSRGEIKIYGSADGRRIAAPVWPGGSVFALSFQPGSQILAAGGFDGRVRLFDSRTGTLIKEFDSVPMLPAP